MRKSRRIGTCTCRKSETIYQRFSSKIAIPTYFVGFVSNNMVILFIQVDYYMDEYQTQLDQAQLKFVRLQGTQKYLQHLKKSEKVEPCPICKQYPENKVCIF